MVKEWTRAPRKWLGVIGVTAVLSAATCGSFAQSSGRTPPGESVSANPLPAATAPPEQPSETRIGPGSDAVSGSTRPAAADGPPPYKLLRYDEDYCAGASRPIMAGSHRRFAIAFVPSGDRKYCCQQRPLRDRLESCRPVSHATN